MKMIEFRKIKLIVSCDTITSSPTSLKEKYLGRNQEETKGINIMSISKNSWTVTVCESYFVSLKSESSLFNHNKASPLKIDYYDFTLYYSWLKNIDLL